MLTTVALLALLLDPAHAYSRGRIGSSTSGCGGTCHSGGPTPTVTLSAPTTAAPGETLTVQFRVASTLAGAGLNVAANGGTLGAGPGAFVADRGEITHDAPAEISGGGHTWTLSWTAPSAPGTYRIDAAGNAVNLDERASGDGWAVTSLSITVAADEDPGGEDSGTQDSGTQDSGTQDSGTPGGDDTGAPDEDADCGDVSADEGGGCAVAPRGPSGAVAVLAAIALLTTGRRRS
jgi:hypothetical protein